MKQLSAMKLTLEVPLLATVFLLTVVGSASTYAQSTSGSLASSSSAETGSSESDSSMGTPRPIQMTTTTPAPTPNVGIACDAGFAAGRTAPHVVVSGTSIVAPVRVVSGCAAAGTYTVRLYDPSAPSSYYDRVSRVYYDWNYRNLLVDTRNNNAGGSVSLGGAATTANVTFTAHCPLNDTMFTAQLVDASTGGFETIGEVYCVHAFPYRAPAHGQGHGRRPPSQIHAWVSTKSYLALANTLLAVWSNWGSSANLVGGLLDNAALSTGFVNYANFDSFQSKANELVNGVDEFNATACDGFSVTNPATAFSSVLNSTGLFVVAAPYRRAAGCAPASTTAAPVMAYLLSMTDVIVVADGATDPAILTDAATQTVTLGYPDASARAVRVTLERYNLNRFERTPTVCGTQGLADLVTIPASGSVIKAAMMEERRFYWNGLCGITQCCIGGKCSDEIHADGRSCILPRIASYGTQIGVTLKRGATESFMVNLYLNFGWKNTGIYSMTGSATGTTLPNTNSGTQLRFRRNSDKRNFCMQLTCIPSAASLTEGGLTPYSNQVCPTDSEWVSWRRYSRYPSWTYYYYSVYGWLQTSQQNNEFTATFTRLSGLSACSCAAIGITTFETQEMLFPTTTRSLDNTVTSTAVDTTKYVIKNLQISTISPMPTDASDSDRKAYCTCWAKADDASPAIQQRSAVVGNCFKCPAIITPTTVLPRGFWRIWGWGSSWRNRYSGDQGSTSQTCFRAFGTWQVGRVPWMRRCCYTANTAIAGGNTLSYINAYPSKVAVSTGWGRWPDYYTERVFAYGADRNPEQVCCRYGGGMASTDSTCRLYRDRRPVERATSSPYVKPRGCAGTWTPMPPRGWGRGDPYCTTMDGAGFECNFWGEALWTSCGAWKVHTVAEPVSVGAKATIITAVAVSEGNETVVIQLNNVTGDSEVRVNGVEQLDDYDGFFLSVSFDETSNNLTIARVTSVAGNHQVEVETTSVALTLSVAPDASCIGACSGLMGNCDGDASNDIKSLDGTVSLSATTSGDAIFSNVVVSFLINDTTQSLFDFTVSVPDNTTSFTPSFITDAVLNSCPSKCNNDPGCCLDNQIAGPTFSDETVSTLVLIETAKKTSVPLTGYNWPPTVSLNPDVAVLSGLPITQEITATDTDGMTSLAISACDESDVSCTRVTTASASNTIKYLLTTTATRNFIITVTAVDSKGATTVAYMTVRSLAPPAPPANSVSFTFTIPAFSVTFNAGHVYEARLYLARDLAAIVNAYWSVGAGTATAGTSVTAAPGTAGAPGFTAASDFTVSAVAGVTGGGVEVTLYIGGDTVADAQSRLDALSAQPTLTLTETLKALSQLVSPDATDATPVVVAIPTSAAPATSGTASPVAMSTSAGEADLPPTGSGAAQATSVLMTTLLFVAFAVLF